jgi:hypothetical protein
MLLTCFLTKKKKILIIWGLILYDLVNLTNLKTTQMTDKNAI